MSVQASSGAGAVTSVVVNPMPAKLATPEETRSSASVELPAVAVKQSSLADEEKALKEAAAKINDFVESMSTDLQFSFDKDADRMVVKVLSRKDGEVIRQIPSREALEIAKALDTLKGLIIRKKA